MEYYAAWCVYMLGYLLSGPIPHQIIISNWYRRKRGQAMGIKQAGGDLRAMAAQVRSAVAWVYKNAASFGADANRLYVGGRSSGAHLTAVALVTDWEREHYLDVLP